MFSTVINKFFIQLFKYQINLTLSSSNRILTEVQKSWRFVPERDNKFGDCLSQNRLISAQVHHELNFVLIMLTTFAAS